MESIIVEIGVDKIKAGLENAANELFKSSYSNPISKILEESIKSREGSIKLMVDDIISNALSNPEFKERLTQAVLVRIVEASLKKS